MRQVQTDIWLMLHSLARGNGMLQGGTQHAAAVDAESSSSKLAIMLLCLYNAQELDLTPEANRNGICLQRTRRACGYANPRDNSCSLHTVNADARCSGMLFHCLKGADNASTWVQHWILLKINSNAGDSM